MEARTLQAFRECQLGAYIPLLILNGRGTVRILYTVNNNPQYILAKSSSQVPVIVCSNVTTQSATNEAAYARAPLKACLAAVCDSRWVLTLVLPFLPRVFSLFLHCGTPWQSGTPPGPRTGFLTLCPRSPRSTAPTYESGARTPQYQLTSWSSGGPWTYVLGS